MTTVNPKANPFGNIRFYEVGKLLNTTTNTPFVEILAKFNGDAVLLQRILKGMYGENLSKRDSEGNYILLENGARLLADLDKMLERQNTIEQMGAFHYDLDAEKGVIYEGVEYRRCTRFVTQEEQPDIGATHRTEISPEERQELVQIFEELFGEEVPEQLERLRAAE